MLWTVLEKMVVSDVIVKLLRNLYMYSGQQVAVRVQGEVSRTWFTIGSNTSGRNPNNLRLMTLF